MAVQVESAKWVPETDFLVDGFRFACARCEHYFLTHAHADHTTGLTRGFARGTIYCTEITARVVHHVIGVSPQFFSEFRLDEPRVVAGVEVTAVDANHCPGAVQFVFKLPSGRVLLHTGDFRYDPAMEALEVWRRLGRPHTVFLDTTYCAPRYKFPTQRETIALIVSLMRDALAREPDTLFLIGTYSIGKERVLVAAARALALRVFVPPKKRRLLECLGVQDEDVFTDDPGSARIRAAPLSLLAFHDMGRMARAGVRAVGRGSRRRPPGEEEEEEEGKEEEEEGGEGTGSEVGERKAGPAPAPGPHGDRENAAPLSRADGADGGTGSGAATPSAAPRADGTAQVDTAGSGLGADASDAVCGADVGRHKAVVGFRPTGWSFSKTRPYSVATQGPCTLYGVPYSEHSSFDELRAYVRFLRPKRLVPTVGGETPRARDRVLARFADLMDLREDRSRLDAYFGEPSRKPREPPKPMPANSAVAPAAASPVRWCGDGPQRGPGPQRAATGAGADAQAIAGAQGAPDSGVAGRAGGDAARDCATSEPGPSDPSGSDATPLEAVNVAEQHAILRAIRERQPGRKRARVARAESTPARSPRRAGPLRRAATQSSLDRFLAK